VLRFQRHPWRCVHAYFSIEKFAALLLAIGILSSLSLIQAQDKPNSSKALKIGFLMDSLKVERWQTDL